MPKLVTLFFSGKGNIPTSFATEGELLYERICVGMRSRGVRLGIAAAAMGVALGWGCSGAERASDSPTYTAAVEKAAEWEKKGIPGLAEAELRKALAEKPDETELKWRLFQAMELQKIPEKRTETLKLVEELLAALPAQDQRRPQLQTLLDEEKRAATRRELVAAVESGKPEAKALLEAYPKDLRDDEYLRLNFLYHYRQPQPERPSKESAAYKAARAWLATKPRDPMALKAEDLVELTEKAPTDTPQAALSALRGQIASGRKLRTKEVYLSTHPDLPAFEKMMAGAKVVGIKEQAGNGKSRLLTTLSFADPYTKETRSATLELVYRKTGKNWLLDPIACDFGQARVFHGDLNRTLTPTGILGLVDFNEALPVVRRDLGLDDKDSRSRRQESLSKLNSVLAFPARGVTYFATYNPEFRWKNGAGPGDKLVGLQKDYVLKLYKFPVEGLEGGVYDLHLPFKLTPRYSGVAPTDWMALVRVTPERPDMLEEILSEDPDVIGQQELAGFVNIIEGYELLEEIERAEELRARARKKLGGPPRY